MKKQTWGGDPLIAVIMLVIAIALTVISFII